MLLNSLQLVLKLLHILFHKYDALLFGAEQEAFEKMSMTGRFDELPALLSAVKDQQDLRSSATSSTYRRASPLRSDDAPSRQQPEELRGRSFHVSHRGSQVSPCHGLYELCFRSMTFD